MFVLDTNVVSELRKTRSNRADPRVVAWISLYEPEVFFISAVTVLELEHGAQIMERRDAIQGAALRAWLERIVYPTFLDRMLPFDAHCARICAGFHVPDPKPERDAMIAATAIRYGFTLVTRNVRDFSGLGVNLLDPFSTAP